MPEGIVCCGLVQALLTQRRCLPNAVGTGAVALTVAAFPFKFPGMCRSTAFASDAAAGLGLLVLQSCCAV